MTEEDKEKQRLLNLPISNKLSKVLEQLSIVTCKDHNDDDKKIKAVLRKNN